MKPSKHKNPRILKIERYCNNLKAQIDQLESSMSYGSEEEERLIVEELILTLKQSNVYRDGLS